MEHAHCAIFRYETVRDQDNDGNSNLEQSNILDDVYGLVYVCALVAAYSHDLVSWCEIKTPVVHFSKLFGVESDMLDSFVEDGGPLQTFALENSLMSDNAFCQMMGTKDEFETLTESKEPNVLKSMASGLEILVEGFANFGLIDNDGKPTKRSISDKEMELKKSRGDSSKSDQNLFHGGAILMDHAIGKIAVHHQVVLSSSDTGVKSKLFFEKTTYNDDIMIQRYHTDNEAFTSKQFLQDFLESQQTKRFSLSDMLDMVMFLVEEEKADESQIPILNKDRLLMSFASVDHYRVKETHVKFNIPPLYALSCYYFGDETASEWNNDEIDSDWKNNKVAMVADAISS
jgi:hypothetical protein